MPDIFGRATEFGAAISADGARVVFDDFTVGFLAQRLNMAYAQQVSRIFELSSNRQYYVVGRPSGNMGMSRIVGPLRTTTAFINKFGDACNADRNTIHASAAPGCSTKNGQLNPAGIAYTAHNALIQQLGWAVQAADMLIQEDFGLMFTGLSAR